jgi:hypothetical protein
MLPIRALFLIREYSKPITHPNWRQGTSHALLLKQSPIMKYIIRQIKNEITNFRTSNLLQFKFGPTIFIPDQQYIQQYGEELLYHIIYFDKPAYINFYTYAKKFLKPTSKFYYKSYFVNSKKYYEYVFIKN